MEAAAQHDPMGRAFAGSLIGHVAIAALAITSGLWSLNRSQFGSEHASSGSVGIGVVKSIPIPRREGPENPLANDTKSVAPQAPAPPQPKPKTIAQEDKAIPIPDLNKKKKTATKPQSIYQPPVAYKQNQVYSTSPQAANSPMYGTTGSGGIDIGPASVLGTRFGAYVDLMKERIGQHWNRAGLPVSSQKCFVTFTLARDGSVSNVRVSQPSGNYLLDTSAQRAVLDASPLPALPQQFPGNSVPVELWFGVTK